MYIYIQDDQKVSVCLYLWTQVLKLRDQPWVFILVSPRFETQGPAPCVWSPGCETQGPAINVYTCGLRFWNSGTSPECLYLWAQGLKLRDQPLCLKPRLWNSGTSNKCLYLWAQVLKLRDKPWVFILVGPRFETQGPAPCVWSPGCETQGPANECLYLWAQVLKLRDQPWVFILVGPGFETQGPALSVYTCGPKVWNSGTSPVCLKPRLW